MFQHREFAGESRGKDEVHSRSNYNLASSRVCQPRIVDPGVAGHQEESRARGNEKTWDVGPVCDLRDGDDQVRHEGAEAVPAFSPAHRAY